MTQHRIGTQVEKIMGVRQVGHVIKPFYGPFTDGQYRQPSKREKAVYVQWQDGSRGWIHAQFLQGKS